MGTQVYLPILFGLLSAIAWGVGDFIGGLAARKANLFLVVVMAELSGLAILLLTVLISGEEFPGFRELLLGAIAGVFGVVGIMALYKGFAVGQYGIVASLSAVLTSLVPVAFGFYLDGVPGWFQILGLLIAIPAIWLISSSSNGSHDTVSLSDSLKIFKYPFIAGLGFGLFFVFIDQVSVGHVYWPIIAARSASVLVVLTFMQLQNIKITRRWKKPSNILIGLILMAGVFDVGGSIFFIKSTQIGRLDISSVLSSLYPAITVLLAWLILREKLGRIQILGVFLSILAIAVITL